VTRTTDISSFAARYDQDAFVVDCREPHEYVQGHVPGAVLVPMSRVSAYLADLPRDREIFVICQSGNRSRAVSDLFNANGMQAVSVDGGTSAWAGLGRPLVAGLEPR
jgi:rhodanese-related sulfurtransferase